MGVNLAGDVSDICIGKPALSSLPPCSTVGDALSALRMGQGSFVSEFSGAAAVARSTEKEGVDEVRSCPVLGKVCMVDVLCYLCSEENISSPVAALDHPVSVLLSKGAATVRRVESNSSIVEALDVILDGAQSLVVPIISATPKRKISGGGAVARFCLLTKEDFVRFFLNSIALFSAVSELSITELGLVRPAAHVVRPYEPALSAVPLLLAALADQTSVAVVTDDGRLLGEISPSTLARCDVDSTAAALAALSAGDLVDCSEGPSDSALRSIKSRLKEKGFDGMLEFLETCQLQFSSSATSSCSSSDDEEAVAPMSPLKQWPSLRRLSPRRSRESYSAKMGRQTEEAIVCHLSSTLVAVMVQALAHRVSYVWVIDGEDHMLAGIVEFSGILQVFRDQLQAD